MFNILLGFVAHRHQVECIDQTHLQVQDTVIDMMMIVMEAEKKTEMVMGERENGVTEMKTDMEEMMTRMAVLEIDIVVETLKNDMEEIPIGMTMITGEEVVAMITTNTTQEAGVLTEIETEIVL